MYWALVFSPHVLCIPFMEVFGEYTIIPNYHCSIARKCNRPMIDTRTLATCWRHLERRLARLQPRVQRAQQRLVDVANSARRQHWQCQSNWPWTLHDLRVQSARLQFVRIQSVDASAGRVQWNRYIALSLTCTWLRVCRSCLRFVHAAANYADAADYNASIRMGLADT